MRVSGLVERLRRVKHKTGNVELVLQVWIIVTLREISISATYITNRMICAT